MQNATHHSINAEDQIQRIKKKHENKPDTILAYLTAIGLGLGSTAFSMILYPTIGIGSYFLLFFPAIVLSTWYGGSKTGVITAFLTTLGLYMVFFIGHPRPVTSNQGYIQLVLFLLAGCVTSYFVDKTKNQNEVIAYRKKEKEYLDLILDLQKKYTTAQAEIKSRDEFLSIASHELKTPLTSMLLQLQTALHNIRNVSLAQFSVENLLKMLDSIEHQSKRVTKMINDLLNVSLITTGRIDLEKEKTDISAVVKNVCEQFSEKVKKDGQVLTCHADTPVIGLFDRLRLEQVVINLLTNAMRYGDKKPIEITAKKQGRNGVIEVTDHGIGIAPDQQEKIFERFQRATNGERFEGLGVGLYISNQIVKAHGGEITIDSEVGHGSTFTVTLPLEIEKK